MWDVEYTDEFEAWWDTLTPSQQSDIDACVDVLMERGPNLGRPYVDSVNGSRHPNMKELRTQSGGDPLRTLFAFNPERTAILLIGGDKTGDDRFYERMIPVADRLYDVHLMELETENQARKKGNG
ncbi:MAG: type II toxin-antitoxin system RelE/ParE family toxin [Pirellulales bacterium]|nr:type II toxin-antitoxin system RelE/ParE family toxin [Pirellulales bacterium]